MKNWDLVLAILMVLYVAKSCSDQKREIRNLKAEVSALKEERPDLWMSGCMRAVDGTCFYGDCAVTPIEIIKEKVCKVPEEL